MKTSLIVQDAIGLFKNQNAHEVWQSHNSKNKPIEVSVWDDYFKMTGMDSEVRFIRFVEKSEHETKEMWLITTLNKGISSKTVWKMMHKR
ncbi:hypothetical protein [Clostridium senegalense]|uniref:hypothetical protein n=1 Tax=Clostridium senegalense TaxID=1465809 RepID=UPI00031A3210|nr:hypothetical protein [Clostridium senegalense]